MLARSTLLSAALLLLAARPVHAAPDAGAAAATPQSEHLRALASGKVTFEAGVDPAQGLVMVDYIEAMPNDDRKSKPDFSTKHLCAAALKKQQKTLQASVAAVLKRASLDDGLQCSGLECVMPGMEYQPSFQFLFTSTASGEVKLLAINEISEAALPAEWQAKAQAFVEKSLLAAKQKPCSVPKAEKKAAK